ncbi:basic salivary proline-rich protein 2-like [Penaeus monodon]|uniref:basic salivary proline-rich protein 2-like n=1 Tax=Penaeus monodon TaxID=6687 RepID=UPI0018A7A6B5|nr:basic salivary proline-rich protein 2-like [Penaeus monodon]
MTFSGLPCFGRHSDLVRGQSPRSSPGTVTPFKKKRFGTSTRVSPGFSPGQSIVSLACGVPNSVLGGYPPTHPAARARRGGGGDRSSWRVPDLRPPRPAPGTGREEVTDSLHAAKATRGRGKGKSAGASALGSTADSEPVPRSPAGPGWMKTVGGATRRGHRGIPRTVRDGKKRPPPNEERRNTKAPPVPYQDPGPQTPVCPNAVAATVRRGGRSPAGPPGQAAGAAPRVGPSDEASGTVKSPRPLAVSRQADETDESPQFDLRIFRPCCGFRQPDSKERPVPHSHETPPPANEDEGSPFRHTGLTPSGLGHLSVDPRALWPPPRLRGLAAPRGRQAVRCPH